MAADWYCRIAGAELGPLSSQQLRALAADGRLRPTDEVRQGPDGRWVQATRVKGLLKGSSPEVLVAQPLTQDARPAGEKPPPAPVKTAASVSARKARKAPQPPELPAVAIPVAKAAASPAAAQATPAPSPFVFTEPEAKQGKSAAGKSGMFSPAEVARRRQKQRKKLLFGSLGILGGAVAIGGMLWLMSPFSGPAEAERAAESRTPDEPVEEVEPGKVDLDIGEFLGVPRRTTEPAAKPADAPDPEEADQADRSEQSGQSDQSDESERSDRSVASNDDQDDAADDDGEVYQLELTEKPVEQALVRDDPDRPLTEFEQFKRENPGLFPDQ